MAQSAQQRENRPKKVIEQSLCDLQDYNKRCNICVIGFPQGQEKEEVAKIVLEVAMVQNLPNLPEVVNVRIEKAE